MCVCIYIYMLAPPGPTFHMKSCRLSRVQNSGYYFKFQKSQKSQKFQKFRKFQKFPKISKNSKNSKKSERSFWYFAIQNLGLEFLEFLDFFGILEFLEFFGIFWNFLEFLEFLDFLNFWIFWTNFFVNIPFLTWSLTFHVKWWSITAITTEPLDTHIPDYMSIIIYKIYNTICRYWTTCLPQVYRIQTTALESMPW